MKKLIILAVLLVSSTGIFGMDMPNTAIQSGFPSLAATMFYTAPDAAGLISGRDIKNAYAEKLAELNKQRGNEQYIADPARIRLFLFAQEFDDNASISSKEIGRMKFRVMPR